MIRLKTEEEIKKLKIGGKKLAKVLEETVKLVKPGVFTNELNDFAHDLMLELGAKPSFLNHTPTSALKPFPASICVSINDEIVHGIPNENPREIRDGDLVTIDAGLVYEGLYTDSAVTVPVGNVSKEARELIERTREALNAAIKQCCVGNRVGDISATIQKIGEKSGLFVVRDLTGHGVGYAVHEDPYVPNFGDAGTGEKLEPGLVIAIEPMFSLGSSEIVRDKDGYTYKTADDSLSAQFEHTVVVTNSDPIVLT